MPRSPWALLAVALRLLTRLLTTTLPCFLPFCGIAGWLLSTATSNVPHRTWSLFVALTAVRPVWTTWWYGSPGAPRFWTPECLTRPRCALTTGSMVRATIRLRFHVPARRAPVVRPDWSALRPVRGDPEDWTDAEHERNRCRREYLSALGARRADVDALDKGAPNARPCILIAGFAARAPLLAARHLPAMPGAAAPARSTARAPRSLPPGTASSVITGTVRC
eukprot:jgi/Mesvir1/21601/Mv26168-RA.1